MNNETRKKALGLADDIQTIMNETERVELNECSESTMVQVEAIGELQSLLQNEQEGKEVSVYDEFKGVKYGTCNGRSKTKCGSDQKEGTEVCEICGTKLIWPLIEKGAK
jgi:hypothetical protein